MVGKPIRKSEEELSVIRETGQLLASVISYRDTLVVPGTFTMRIND
ncbi:hypothetical protein [Vreelandella nanhaiensis]|nr:hypothetical protein [Halomonas nanhaiensis]